MGTTKNRNDRLVPKVGTINLAVKKGMVPKMGTIKRQNEQI